MIRSETSPGPRIRPFKECTSSTVATFQWDDGNPKSSPWKNGWKSPCSSMNIWWALGFQVPTIHPIITWFHPTPSGKISSPSLPGEVINPSLISPRLVSDKRSTIPWLPPQSNGGEEQFDEWKLEMMAGFPRAPWDWPYLLTFTINLSHPNRVVPLPNGPFMAYKWR